MSINWKEHTPGVFYDELISTPGNARVCARGLISYLASLSGDEINLCQQTANITPGAHRTTPYKFLISLNSRVES